MTTPAEHAATVEMALTTKVSAPMVAAAVRSLAALVALAERATELERERDEWKNRAEYEEDQKRTASKGYLDMQARAEQLETALREVLAHVQTRRTGIHMDGKSQYGQPILAEIDAIARAALDGGTT